jgi:hypothetical protein
VGKGGQLADTQSAWGLQDTHSPLPWEENGGPFSLEGVTMVGQIETQTKRSSVDLDELVRLEGSVRLRAYELYEQRGRDDGHALDDWLQAESEIVRTRAKAIGA